MTLFLLSNKENLKPALIRLFTTMTAGLSALIILLITATLWVAVTESGSRWLLRTLISTTEQVNIVTIKGTLINGLSLKQLHYQDANNFQVSVANLKLQWQALELIQGHLHINALQLTGVNIKGRPTSPKDSTGNNKISHIPVIISIDQLAIRQLNWNNGDSKTHIQQLAVSAILKKQTLTVSRLELSMPQLQINAHSVVHLQTDWPLSATLNWRYIFDNDAKITGRMNLSGNIDKLILSNEMEGVVKASQSGIIRLSSKQQPEFDLKGNWQQLQWPLISAKQIRSNHGEFTVQGTIQHYQAKLNAKVAIADHPGIAFIFFGNGNQNTFNIAQLLIKSSPGQIKLHGQISWAKMLAYNLIVNAQQLRPLDFGVNIPGRLNLEVHSKGNIIANQINADVDIKKLTGEIYNQPVNVKGRFMWADQQLNIRHINVSAAGNQLQANGWLNKQQVDLDVNITAPHLSSAWPTLNGNLQANAQIKGALLNPIINGNIQGHHIRYDDDRIGRLSVKVDYNPFRKRQSTIDFLATQLHLAGQQIDRITLQGNGEQSKHNIRLQLYSPLGKLILNTNGHWDGKQWLLKITQLEIEHSQIKHWQLQSPSTFILTRSKQDYLFKLKKSCLLQASAHLCVTAQGLPNKQTNARLSLSNWPLALTKTWLPEQLAFAGMLSAQAQLSSHGQNIQTKMDLSIADGSIIFKNENNLAHKVSVTDATLKSQYQQDYFNSQLHLVLGNRDTIAVEIKADKANANGIRQLSGYGRAKITDMKIIDTLLPEINQLQGVWVTNLQINGSTAKPVITGFTRWQNGRLKIPRLGDSFHNINLQINSETDNPLRLMFSTEAQSGSGKMFAKGYLDLLPEHHYPLHMTLQGKQFQISRLPEAEVSISPLLNINKYDNITKIDGLIDIDNAQIKLKTLPENAIAPSKDEVIISSNRIKPQKNKLSQLDTDISIQMGENCHFSGFGLNSRLTGQLKYTVRHNNQSMHGRAIMRDARYRSYGQDLTLRKGEFLFNGPVDNPWLNIEAIRKATSENITAVLNVSGPLKSPKTRIYSEPPLPESEALAYLITGKSMKNMSNSDNNAVAGAALSYGVGQLSWLTEQLGIDEFSFKQADNIKDSAVKLGHYLNPNLYVGVTMGLFSTTYAADIRYRLNKYFSIDTRAGETQRIDIKYHLESE